MRVITHMLVLGAVYSLFYVPLLALFPVVYPEWPAAQVRVMAGVAAFILLFVFFER